MKSDTVVVLGTGGTIAGRAAQARDNIAYTAAQIGVADLLAEVPWPPHLRLETEQVLQIDSKDMDEDGWRALLAAVHRHLQRPEVMGLVITHGTDTLEETAYLLQAALQPAKPVVMTCAMRPATSLAPDGPQNLTDALALVRTPGASGVVVVCAGQVHSALEVQKAHTYRTDAFDSGDAGPLGVIEEGRYRAWRAWPEGRGAAALATLGAEDGWPLWRDPAPWPRVEWLVSHGGAQAWAVQALLRDPEAPALAGLVVAGTGNGTLHHRLETALRQAHDQGVVVWRTTRCARGQVLSAAQQGLGDAVETPVAATAGWPAVALPASKARLALTLWLLSQRARPGLGR